MPERIVIIEDDAYLRDELASILVGAHYEAVAFERFDTVIAEVLAAAPRLVLLDLGLPGTSGYEIIESLRSQGSSALILVLTANDQLSSELHALDLGADDYLTKPVEAARLLARISALLRRSGEGSFEHSPEGSTDNSEGRFLIYDHLKIDPLTFTLYSQNTSVHLTPQEGRLLAALVEARGNLVTKQQLCTALWGTIEFIDENALQVSVARLRKTLRLAGLADPIHTVRGEGLRLRTEGRRKEDV